MSVSRKVVVIGGTGHVGSYLCPRLAATAGTEVVCISRGKREPYPAAAKSPEEVAAGWAKVTRVALDRDADMAAFCAKLVELKPTHIIDMVMFTEESCKAFTEGLLSHGASATACIKQLIHVGSIWSYGPTIAAPTTEDGPHADCLDDYGTQKRAIEHYLLRGGAPTTPWTTTIFHPGHIVGRGWPPLNPQGHFNPNVFLKFKTAGQRVLLPNVGSETVHHIHADDIASAFIAAMDKPDKCAGQAYSIVSPQALSLRGYAHAVGKQIWPHTAGTPDIVYTPCPSHEFEADVGKGSVWFTLDHTKHSPCASVAKLERDLGFKPAWSSLEAVADAVTWLEESGDLETCWYPGKEKDQEAA